MRDATKLHFVSRSIPPDFDNTDTWNSIVHGRYIDTSECVSKCERNLCISLFWKRHNTGLCLNKNSDVFVHNCLLYFHGRKKKVVCKWQWNLKAGPMQTAKVLGVFLVIEMIASTHSQECRFIWILACSTEMEACHLTWSSQTKIKIKLHTARQSVDI